MATKYKIREKIENISFDFKTLLCLQEIEDFINKFYNEEMVFSWNVEFQDHSISADTFHELYQNNLFQMENLKFDSLTLGISPKNRYGTPIIFTIAKDYKDVYYISFYGETENAKFKLEIKDFIINLINNKFKIKEDNLNEKIIHQVILNHAHNQTKKIDWTMIGVIIGLVGLILTVFINLEPIKNNIQRIITNLNKSNIKTINYKEITKNIESKQIINSVSAIEYLRKNRKLNLINDLENELTIDKIENNTYSFTYGFNIDTALKLKKKFKVFKKDNDYRFEIHKYFDKIYIIGYTNEENKIRLNAQETKYKFYLFNRPNVNAEKLVSVPFSNISSFSERSYKDSMVADVELK